MRSSAPTTRACLRLLEVVVAAGVRSVFLWQKNWIGFIDAQIQPHDEIALHAFGDPPYDGVDRGERLARAVQAIKRQETERWRARRKAGVMEAPGGASSVARRCYGRRPNRSSRRCCGGASYGRVPLGPGP
jgi:hypothetical protein